MPSLFVLLRAQPLVLAAALVLTSGCIDFGAIAVDPDASVADTPDVLDVPDVPNVLPTPPTPLVTGSDIRDVDYDATRLYWVDWGTVDSLGNHNHDGALRARPRAGGPTETLLSGLWGPTRVFVSPSYLYVSVREVPPAYTSVIRIPIGGGASEPFVGLPTMVDTSDPVPLLFFDRVDASGTGTWTVREDGTALATFPNEVSSGPRLVGSFIYYVGWGYIGRVPLAGGTEERSFPGPEWNAYDLVDGELLYVESTGGAYWSLNRNAFGAEKKRIANLDSFAPNGYTRLEAEGDRFVVVGGVVYVGNLSAPSTVHPLDFPTQFNAWELYETFTLTPDGLYWSDGHDIFFHTW